MNEKITLQDVLTSTKGALKAAPKLNHYDGVGTDTRVDLLNKIFIPLKGETYDAHDFLDKAIEQRAALLIVHRVSEQEIEKYSKKGVGIVLVEDTLKALQDLGSFRRHQSTAKIISITGSNGKTSSKEFTAALLGASFQVHSNEGSFNNHWGVPLTLLGIQPQHQVVVSEMGMNHPGELTELAKIGDPDIVVCTIVGRAHLEGLGSIEGVAQAKEELYLASKPTATRIFNLDNPWTLKMCEHSKKLFPQSRVITFSEDQQKANQVDIYLKVNRMTLHGLEVEGQIAGVSGKTTVGVFGKHNVTNLMVAACCALAMGISAENIWKNLKLCKSAWGRNQLVQLKSGATVLFDGYNANPDSMRALLENIKFLDNESNSGSDRLRKFTVLGEMREQGSHAPQLHFELGALASTVGFHSVWFIGEHFEDFKKGFESQSNIRGKAQLFVDQDFDLNNNITKNHFQTFVNEITPSDLIAIKGSRGMKLERILEGFQELIG